MKKYIPFAIKCVFLFYILPLLLSLLPIVSGILHLLMPILTVFFISIIGLKYGSRHGFSIILPIIAIIIFTPSIWINNYSIFRFGFLSGMYFIALFISILLGLMFREKK